jgi:glycosyltransferase involved in cell wall biosynthesis
LKVSGFTFIRNAITLDYPVVESIQSILPLCDEVVVAVGNSEDQTLELIQNIDPKVKVIQTIWDDNLRANGAVLALETDKALAAIDPEADWAFYIQGDEVIHEEDHHAILAALQKYQHDHEVDGLLFNYLHFYGSYDYVGISNNWYKKEIRIIKPGRQIRSYRDAQGFRKAPDQKLKVAAINARVFHYGWVKDPRAMQRKQENFHKLWHDDAWLDKNVKVAERFDYEDHIHQLARFEGTHPACVQARIAKRNWVFETDITRHKKRLKNILKDWLKKIGIDTHYANYTIIRK